MVITIQIRDQLAQRIQAEATQQNITVEELAHKILEGAIPNQMGDDWGPRNQRRLELIRKSGRCELAPNEQDELKELQAQLDERFEAFDNGLVQQLDEMKRAVTDEVRGNADE